MQEADAVALVKGVQDNANRLGLAWQIRIATVVDVTDPANPSIVFDGDDTGTPGPAISTIGNPGANSRVYVLDTPGPDGTSGAQYIIGPATPRPPGEWSYKKTLTSTQAAIVVPIPFDLTDLEVRWTARCDTGATFSDMRVQVNGDSSASYAWNFGQFVSAAAYAGSFSPGTTYYRAGYITGATAPADHFGSGVIFVTGWDRPHTKTLGFNSTSQALAVPTTTQIATTDGGVYNQVVPAAYTSLTFIPGGGAWVAGTSIRVYGRRV